MPRVIACRLVSKREDVNITILSSFFPLLLYLPLQLCVSLRKFPQQTTFISIDLRNFQSSYPTPTVNWTSLTQVSAFQSDCGLHLHQKQEYNGFAANLGQCDYLSTSSHTVTSRHCRLTLHSGAMAAKPGLLPWSVYGATCHCLLLPIPLSSIPISPMPLPLLSSPAKRRLFTHRTLPPAEPCAYPTITTFPREGSSHPVDRTSTVPRPHRSQIPPS